MESKKEKRPACLLLHGFTGGPYEVLPLAEAMEDAGWACRVPVLPGHDHPHLQTLREACCEDWLQAACSQAEELTAENGCFDLVGFSMGGMLAVHVAARYPVRRLVLLGAAAVYVSPGRLVRDFLEHRGADDLARHKMRQTPVTAVLEFMRLVHRVRPDLRRVTAPCLVMQGLRDPIVHPVSARYLSKRLPEPKVVYLPKSRHLLCLDEEADEVVRSVMDFLEWRQT